MPPRPIANDQLLDLAFVIDSTGSMWPYISEAEAKVKEIATKITKSAKLTDPSNLRIGVVGFRDYPETKDLPAMASSPLDSNVKTAQTFIGKLRAAVGGDGPEAVFSAIDTALKLKWKPLAHKVIIIITDAPPHGIESPTIDKNPKADPANFLTTLTNLRKGKFNLFVAKCFPTMQTEYQKASNFYNSFAQSNGGATVILSDAQFLGDAVIGLTLETKNIKDVLAELTNNTTKSSKPSASKPVGKYLSLIATSIKENESDKAEDARHEVKKILQDKRFTSVHTNMYDGDTAPEDRYNAKIMADARSINDMKKLKSNPQEFDGDQTLSYREGPINDHQINRLALMYAATVDGGPAAEDEGGGKDTGDDGKRGDDDDRGDDDAAAEEDDDGKGGDNDDGDDAAEEDGDTKDIDEWSRIIQQNTKA